MNTVSLLECHIQLSAPTHLPYFGVQDVLGSLLVEVRIFEGPLSHVLVHTGLLTVSTYTLQCAHLVGLVLSVAQGGVSLELGEGLSRRQSDSVKELPEGPLALNVVIKRLAFSLGESLLKD